MHLVPTLSLVGQGGGGDAPADPDEILLETGDKLLLETGSALVKDSGIPALAAAAALDGSEYVIVVQSGVNKRLTVTRLYDYLRAH